MKELVEQLVLDLKDRGHGFMPIDIDLLESAESAARIFLLAKDNEWEDWSFSRKDNTELGIVEEVSSTSALATEKVKSLCFAHDLSRRRSADTPHTRACLSAVTNLYRDMRRRVTDLCFGLDRHCGVSDVTSRIRDTFELGDERATTLHMRSAVCGRRSLRNTLHAESVFSIYFGNDKNEIWLKGEQEKKWGLCSPPYGSALVFFGQQVSELGNPVFLPSQYRVEAHAGRRICASVMHVQIKEAVAALPEESNVESLLTK